MVKPLLTLLLVISMVSSAFADGYSVDKELNVAVINDIDIGYIVAGEVDAPPVVLIMGLTASHRLWPENFVDQLTASGYRVVLFDNRDTGASQRMDHLGEPTLWWEMIKSAIGFDVSAPYSLGDMAQDTIGVMDELGIKKAHIVGASMGGMIAQTVAARFPERTLTLTSIMSTTGAPDLPEPEGDAGSNLQDLGGAEGDRAQQLNDLGIYPTAMPRQLLAIVAAGDRTLEVASIKSPTLVVHGKDDPLLPVAHGQRTHETISGSSYVVYDGMAHNLPDTVVGQLVQEMVGLFERS